MALDDIKRVKDLRRFIRKDKKRLLLIVLILLPVSIAGAIQPLLVGQAISVLRDESTIGFLIDLPKVVSIRIIISLATIIL